MSRKKIVAGNWKMNTDHQSARQLAEAVANKSEESEVTLILFPPSLFIDLVNEAVANSSIKTGAQNCSDKDKGAFTGEISAAMIKSCGSEYCLVGHSERRMYFKESPAQLKDKIQRCLENSLVPVYCVGEKLEERKGGNHFSVVESQLSEVLSDFTEHEVASMILAYEPVWAIGTGETASPEQAQEMHAFIRSSISKMKGQHTADQIVIIYGGSCNAQNAKELFSCKDVDGGLIGGASLKADDFITISKSF